jgi:hypothetical protein
MAVKEGARYRSGAAAGQYAGGWGIEVYAGTPVSGTFGAGTLEKGGLVINSDTGKLFINTGTKATPTWTVVGGQS